MASSFVVELSNPKSKVQGNKELEKIKPDKFCISKEEIRFQL